MDNEYAAHLRQLIAVKKLHVYRQRQEMDRLNAADNGKLLTLIGREVVLRMHEPAFLTVAKLVLPTLHGRHAANLRTALRAVEPEADGGVLPGT